MTESLSEFSPVGFWTWNAMVRDCPLSAPMLVPEVRTSCVLTRPHWCRAWQHWPPRGRRRGRSQQGRGPGQRTEDGISSDNPPPTWRVCGVPGLREEEWSEGGERMPRPLLGGDRMPLPRPPAVGGDTTLPLPRPTEAGDSTLVGGDTRGVHKYLDTNDPFNKCFQLF